MTINNREKRGKKNYQSNKDQHTGRKVRRAKQERLDHKDFRTQMNSRDNEGIDYGEHGI